MVLPKLEHNNYCSLLKLSNVVLDSYPYGSKYSCFETISENTTSDFLAKLYAVRNSFSFIDISFMSKFHFKQ